MKITKRQLRRIIREEKARLLEDDKYAQLPQAGDPAEAARLKAQRDAATVPHSDINTNIEVPVELFDQLAEYLEDMSGLKLKGSGFIASRARELLLKLERETGVL